MKKLISFGLCVLMIMTMVCMSVSAIVNLNSNVTSNASGTFSLAVGSCADVVGKCTSMHDDAVTGIGMNVLGWKKNTTTLDNTVGITVPSKYTGYITMSVVPYPTGGTPILSLSRTRGTKDSSNANYPTWYKELTKASYTSAVTSYASIEGTYSDTDYYYGSPSVINAHR